MAKKFPLILTQSDSILVYAAGWWWSFSRSGGLQKKWKADENHPAPNWAMDARLSRRLPPSKPLRA